MIKHLAMIIILITFDRSLAGDWLCTTESSQKQGSSIYACGIGMAETEDVAREKALAAAKREFQALCDLSQECKDGVNDAKPMRTDCGPSGGQIKCYRGVLFSPVAKNEKNSVVRTKPKEKPKIRVGMTRDELLDEMGSPEKVNPPGDFFQPFTTYTYPPKTPGCKAIFCRVFLRGDKVHHYDPEWSLSMTDALEH